MNNTPYLSILDRDKDILSFTVSPVLKEVIEDKWFVTRFVVPIDMLIPLPHFVS